MAFRPMLAPLSVLIWAATAIIHGAHATEHPRVRAELYHDQYNKSCHPTVYTDCEPIRYDLVLAKYQVDKTDDPMGAVADLAEQYQGFTEKQDRDKLEQLFSDTLGIEINPRRTPWCAAFVNAVLVKLGYAYSGSIESVSFVKYGIAVKIPARGDIIVLKGVGGRSPTHVGFFVGTIIMNGRLYYGVLGGNQSNAVKVSYFPASKVIAIRRVG